MCVIDCTPTLETPRLKLRPIRESDTLAIARYASDMDVARMSSRMPHPYSLDEAKSFVDRAIGVGCERPLFAIAGENDALIGALGFDEPDAIGAPELGYWLGKPFWGKGLATEAVSAALAWARDSWGRKVVRAGHFADNDASAGVLIKSDFLYTGEVIDAPSVARGGTAPLRMLVWLA